MDVVL
jgi:hypothetical protein